MSITPDRVVLSPEASRHTRVWSHNVCQPHEEILSIQVEMRTEWLPRTVSRNKCNG